MNTLTPDESRRAANAVYEAGREIVRLREQLAEAQATLLTCQRDYQQRIDMLQIECDLLAQERDAALARADHAERNLQAADAMALVSTAPLTPAQFAAGAEIGATLERELIRDFVEGQNAYLASAGLSGWPAWGAHDDGSGANGEDYVMCFYCRAASVADGEPLAALSALEHTPACPVQRGRLWLSAERHAVAVAPQPAAPDAAIQRLVACAREYARRKAVAVQGNASASDGDYMALFQAERDLHVEAFSFGDPVPDALEGGAS